MKQADQTTCVTDRLLVPNDLFIWAMTLVLGTVFVFLNAEFLVRLADGEDEKQGVRRTGDEGEQFGLVDAEDVVKCELLGQAELVDQRGHYLWVILYGLCFSGHTFWNRSH